MKTTNKIEIFNPSLKADEITNEIIQAVNDLLSKHKNQPLLKITIMFERGTLSTRESEEVDN